MMRYATAAVTALLLLPAGASAQGSEAPASDPDAGSPSGTVYELPLERGRQDAAPRKRPRGKGEMRSGERSSGATTDSPIRSENNFGSSSQVPGIDDDRADADGAAGGSGGDGNGRAGGKGNQSPSGEGGGTGSTGRSAAAIGVAPTSSSFDGPSWGLIVPLIAILLLLGVTAGALAGCARRS